MLLSKLKTHWNSCFVDELESFVTNGKSNLRYNRLPNKFLLVLNPKPASESCLPLISVRLYDRGKYAISVNNAS